MLADCAQVTAGTAWDALHTHLELSACWGRGHCWAQAGAVRGGCACRLQRVSQGLAACTFGSMAAGAGGQVPGSARGVGAMTAGVLCADCRGRPAGLGLGGMPACSSLSHTTNCQDCGLHGCLMHPPPCQAAALPLKVLPSWLYCLKAAFWLSALQGSLLLPTTHHVHGAQTGAYSRALLASTQHFPCLYCSAPVL